MILFFYFWPQLLRLINVSGNKLSFFKKKLSKLCIKISYFQIYNSIETVYRAYIPSLSIKWFNDEFLDGNSKIDVWLSTRLNHDNLTRIEHKYICEFRTSDSQVINENELELKKHKIRLSVLINDLYKLNERTKRNVFSSNSKVAGRYVSSEKVFTVYRFKKIISVLWIWKLEYCFTLRFTAGWHI